MSAIGRVRAWLRAVLTRDRMEREMHDEMSAHIAQATERFMARGMSERDALLAARREFGHLGAVQQHARDARAGQWIDSLIGDLKYAFRYYARTPLTTITIILTLALGIGFSSAVFSVVNGIVRRPAPGVPDDPKLVKIRGISNSPPFARPLSYPELSAYASLTDKFSSVAAWGTSSVVVDIGETDIGAISAVAQFVTPNYLATLGVKLAAGRVFTQSRFGEVFPAELTAIVSHAFATARLGGVQAAVGKQVKVNDVPVTIIGVTAPRFNGAVQSGWARTIWLPLSSWQAVARVNSQIFSNPNAYAFEAIARLRPGITLAEALPSVRVVAARADAVAKARMNRTWTATADVIRLRGIMDLSGRYGELGPGATMASAAALLILLVCTTTVNSLLLGAAVARRYETGVRLALGASRNRVVRQFLTEISVLALAGGALGMWVFGALGRLTEIAQDGFDVSPNWQTTGFTVLYALLAATLCGLSPALHATRTGLSDVLKDSPIGATRRSRLQRTFVVAQLVVVQPMMVALAAVIANFVGEIAPSGNAALREQVVAATFDTYAGFNRMAPDKIPRLMQRIAGLPGVAAVVPMSPGYGKGEMSLQLAPSPGSNDLQPRSAAPSAFAFDVSPGYFRAVDAPIVRGRDLMASDTASALTAVVLTEPVAAALFKSRDPIGQRLHGVSRYDGSITELEVVGVVRMEREVFFSSVGDDVPPVFTPLRRQREGLLLIRTTGPAELLIPTIVAVAKEEARTLPLERIRTLAQIERSRRGNWVKAIGAVVSGGAFALLLSSIGLYAMVSIAVAQRRREIGIRMALGAGARQVVSMFFTSGLRTTLLGIVLGLPLNIAGLAAIRSMLYRQWDHMVAVPVIVVLAVLGVAALASWLPARRAASVDPMVALRSE